MTMVIAPPDLSPRPFRLTSERAIITPADAFASGVNRNSCHQSPLGSASPGVSSMSARTSSGLRFPRAQCLT